MEYVNIRYSSTIKCFEINKLSFNFYPITKRIQLFKKIYV